MRIRIDFDRPVDQGSVSSRFSLRPQSLGRVLWPSKTEMLYVPRSPLQTDTVYRVLLRAGYRSQGGGAADLDHAWTFRTEGAPEVTGWSPAASERQVDPATTVVVSFSHRLSYSGLSDGFRIEPAQPITAMIDPADPFRAIVVPQGLLEAGTTYRITATTAIHDADGNALSAGTSSTFTTGPNRPLHGWLTCIATNPAGDAGSSSLWALDPDHVGRRLLYGPVLDYHWAPSADEVVVESAPRSWQDEVIGAGASSVPIPADLVLPLGHGRGFVYLDQGRLGLLSSAGAATQLAEDVDSLALSPDGTQLAYTVAGVDGIEIWGLTIDLRSRFEIGRENGAVSSLSWAPDGSRVAYLLTTATSTVARVRTLTDSTSATVTGGGLEDLAWDADSQHLYVVALSGPIGPRRLYRLPVTNGPQSLPSGTGLTGASLQLAAGPPQPSPDGHQLALVAATAANPSEVWLINADGTGLVRLTGLPDYSYSCRDPRWTPPA